jgi:flagellar hook-associated protein 1 FlgK
MSSNLYSIGLSGLNAAQAGIVTTGHNISNVNTANYSRQQVVQSASTALFSGSGFIGQGTNVTTVRRVYSDFLSAQARQVQASASQADAYQAQLTQLDNTLGSTTSGLSPALTDFFSALNTVATNPSDTASRQAFMSSAQALVGRFQQLDSQLSAQRDDANTTVTATVAEINAAATGIAALNRQIVAATATGQPPNDLLDQRDGLIANLNQQIGATAVTQGDGSVNVFLASGQALVVGQDTAKLAATPDTADPQNVGVGIATAGGVVRLRAVDVQGGSLGAAISFRDGALADARSALGRIAVGVGQAFNAQNQLGLDLKGQPGAALFSIPAPTVQPALDNTGTAKLAAAITNASSLTTSDYTLRFDGTNYALTRASDNTTQTFSSLPQTVDGVTLTLSSGAMAAGDRFLIQPTRYAARDIALATTDPAKVAAAAPVRTAATSTNTGGGQIAFGAVDASYAGAPLAAKVTLAYNAAAGTLSGFPAGAAVTVTNNGTATTYPAGTAVPYTAGATMAFGGMSFRITGAPANGDTFTLAPNTGAAGDGRNALLLAGLQTTSLLDGGTSTFAAALGNLVAAVGTQTKQAQLDSDAQASLLTQATSAQQTVSGVNLDEEAANLQRYQQAYQAAGKVLAIASTLFDTILSIKA